MDLLQSGIPQLEYGFFWTKDIEDKDKESANQLAFQRIMMRKFEDHLIFKLENQRLLRKNIFEN